MFFERFREALARLPAGLIRAGEAADPAALTAAETTFGRALPASFLAFLGSFDGADLFHESVLVAGVGAAAARRLADLNPAPAAQTSSPGRAAEPVFAEAAGGDRFAFSADGAVVCLRAGSDERWRAGGRFESWLDGLIAHERLLFGADGEFLPDLYEEGGWALRPTIALRQAERALKACPDSALWQQERGTALRRMGHLPEARGAFAQAAALDPGNPWPPFDQGRVALALGPAGAREALSAFTAAARLQQQEQQGDVAARLWIWAARAAVVMAAPDEITRCRGQALAIRPALADDLERAVGAAREAGDADEIGEAEALREALVGPIAAGRARLPVWQGQSAPQSAPPRTPPRAPQHKDVSAGREAPARQTQRSARRRPRPASPPRSAGPRAGRRR